MATKKLDEIWEGRPDYTCTAISCQMEIYK